MEALVQAACLFLSVDGDAKRRALPGDECNTVPALDSAERCRSVRGRACMGCAHATEERRWVGRILLFCTEDECSLVR